MIEGIECIGRIQRLAIAPLVSSLLLGSAVFAAAASDPSSSSEPLRSAKRAEGESFLESMVRYERELDPYKDRSGGGPSLFNVGTAFQSALPLEELAITSLPEWTSDELEEVFSLVRDARFLRSHPRSSFRRRISWLYPDDGCYARASVVRAVVASNTELVPPQKAFIFGQLRVPTNNSPYGYVRWGWHVVPVVAVDGTAMVIDPAIDPTGPLSLEDWASRQTDDVETVSLAICDQYTEFPDSSCQSPQPASWGRTLSSQRRFLNYEWNRQIHLGRNPYRVLGRHPPWLND